MQTGFARKYAIMEELDGGFSTGSTPEAFVRLDCWNGRIQVSIHVKGLKQGPYKHMLYLIFSRNGKLVPVLAGPVNTSYAGMQSGLEIDAETLRNLNVKPEEIRYAALTAESNNRKWIPLFSSFEKNYKWDESIRQAILMKPEEEEQQTEPARTLYREETDPQYQPRQVWAEEKTESDAGEKNDIKTDAPAINVQNDNLAEDVGTRLNPPPPKSGSRESAGQRMPRTGREYSPYKCDINKLEGMLSNNFEAYQPFKRPNRGYSWYRVSDLAKLSNIMYMSGINVPLFANPKILVGLFKFKHILAGLYRGDNGAQYYVIGVPAKDEKDNKPFENACKWVSVSESQVRDMGGYWLVYVSLKSGEIIV
ncbi:MAG TPA: hypothetical protein GXX26_05165 [Clostridiaceae bacterium]|nr:hypothetical protein [Clostridiaceae bacterium]